MGIQSFVKLTLPPMQLWLDVSLARSNATYANSLFSHVCYALDVRSRPFKHCICKLPPPIVQLSAYLINFLMVMMVVQADY